MECIKSIFARATSLAGQICIGLNVCTISYPLHSEKKIPQKTKTCACNMPSTETKNTCMDIVSHVSSLAIKTPPRPPKRSSGLRIHSSPARGQCVSGVQGQLQKWTNWLAALSGLSTASCPPGVTVNRASCLDNCPEVMLAVFSIQLMDRQTENCERGTAEVENNAIQSLWNYCLIEIMASISLLLCPLTQGAKAITVVFLQ